MTNNNPQKDPGQFVPPRVDTSVDIIGGLNSADMKAGLPAATSLLGSGVGLATGNIPLFAGGLVGGVALGVAGVGMRVTNRWYTSPKERLEGWVSHLQRTREGDDSDLSDVHGVVDVTQQGYLKMDDGRYVAPIPIEPRNTAKLDADQQHSIAATLSSAIDEQIRDMPFRLYSTTRETDVDDIADRYETRAMNPTLSDPQSDVLVNVADWLRDMDEPNWETREWNHYLVVEADVGTVLNTGSRSMIDMLNPLHETEEVPEDRIISVLSDRVETVRNALNTVTGLHTSKPTPKDSLSVARHYWGREDELNEELVDAAVSEDDEVSGLLDAEWNPRKGWVQVGDQYAKTLWLAEYPIEVKSLWLKRLCTLRGVNVDLTVNVEPEHLDSAIHEVSKDAADVGSEGQERAEGQDLSAMDTDSAYQANRKLRELLKETPSQAWQMSVYVTVRATDRDALSAAQDEMASFSDLDGAKMGALEDSLERVRDTLTRTPANTTPITPQTAQPMAFQAGSPLTGDVWDEQTKKSKTRRVPGAVIGAMFPFAAVDLREEDGMDWGRNEENGTHLRLSPFLRGGAPHMLTIGQTRSGKTYSASKAAGRWYLEGDDRTLIVCDTQKGFDGLTQLCGGKHIVVDGEQSINPLRIESTDDHRSDGADEFRMTVEETVGFLVGLLESDEVENAGSYAPLLGQAAERTLKDHGMTPSDPYGSTGDMPHLGDLMETLVDMNDNPDDYTWSNEGYEVESHKEQIGDLLTKLRSFQESGRFANLVGSDELGILDEDVDMAYLDLHNLPTSGDAGKSAMLQLMLSQVREKIKQTEGEVIFMLDEAHVLLDNDRTLDWLQKAVREFARYDASLWFLSQSPEDFVSQEKGSAKNVIRQQIGVTHFFRTPFTDGETEGDDVLMDGFGMNNTQSEFVQDKAVRGKSGRGFSECLIDYSDVEGWIPCYVESTPLEDHVLTYERRNHGGQGTRQQDFVNYMARFGSTDTTETTEPTDTMGPTETDGQERDERGRFV